MKLLPVAAPQGGVDGGCGPESYTESQIGESDDGGYALTSVVFLIGSSRTRTPLAA
jgi:hypothetical protein